MSDLNTHHRPAMASLMCMMSMLIWAVGLPAADLLIGPVPPLQLTAARMAMATVCLLPVWCWLEGSAVLRAARWWRGMGIGADFCQRSSLRISQAHAPLELLDQNPVLS